MTPETSSTLAYAMIEIDLRMRLNLIPKRLCDNCGWPHKGPCSEPVLNSCTEPVRNLDNSDEAR